MEQIRMNIKFHFDGSKRDVDYGADMSVLKLYDIKKWFMFCPSFLQPKLGGMVLIKFGIWAYLGRIINWGIVCDKRKNKITKYGPTILIKFGLSVTSNDPKHNFSS